MTDRDALKQAAGERAVDWIASGMVVGLGTGSTAIHAIRRIAALIQSGELRDVLGVPTSTASEASARELGIPLTTLGEHPVVDLTIDGADEVDPALNLIKGGGGALLHEKIVAQASLREVIIVDESSCHRPSARTGRCRWRSSHSGGILSGASSSPWAPASRCDSSAMGRRSGP